MASFLSPVVSATDWTKPLLSPSPNVKVIIAYAAFSKPSLTLLAKLKEIDCTLVGLDVGADDEVEEFAIDLNLTSIPSMNVYLPNTDEVYATFGSGSTLGEIEAAIEAASTMTHTDYIRSRYGATATNKAGCCVSVTSTANGYSHDDLLKAGAGADLGVGCGNPLSFANLQPAETVVDLGSGGGIDCFIAGLSVGSKGAVIGVDMTPEMLSRARNNAKTKGVENVTFRLGEIEHLPVADNCADVIISNCVINLSNDKPQVLREAYRALKSGGRFCVCDVVTRDGIEMPMELQTAEAAAC